MRELIILVVVEGVNKKSAGLVDAGPLMAAVRTGQATTKLIRPDHGRALSLRALLLLPNANAHPDYSGEPDCRDTLRLSPLATPTSRRLLEVEDERRDHPD